MPGPKWNLEEDLKTVTVTFPTSPIVQIKLDLAGVEEMLKNLGEFRAHMQPQVDSNYAMGQKVGVVPDPTWVTEPDALNGDTILHIRDPRFGWLHYLIPRNEAHKLSSYIQEQVKQPEPVAKGKPN